MTMKWNSYQHIYYVRRKVAFEMNAVFSSVDELYRIIKMCTILYLHTECIKELHCDSYCRLSFYRGDT